MTETTLERIKREAADASREGGEAFSARRASLAAEHAALAVVRECMKIAKTEIPQYATSSHSAGRTSAAKDIIAALLAAFPEAKE